MNRFSTINLRDNSRRSAEAKLERAIADHTLTDFDAVTDQRFGDLPTRLFAKRYVDDMTSELLTRLAEGYDAYVLTFMFKPLPTAMTAIMTRAVEEAYSRVLTRVIRNPNTSYNKDRAFVWLGFPDFPSEGRKQAFADVAINDGRHIHVVVSVPPFTRLKYPFDEFVRQNRALFLTDGVRWVHVEPFDHTYKRGMDYFAKSLLRGRIGFDDIICLPRSQHEMADRKRHPNNGRPGQVRRAAPVGEPVVGPFLRRR